MGVIALGWTPAARHALSNMVPPDPALMVIGGSRQATMTDVRIDSRLLGWGVFFLVLGAVPLAVGQGWIDPAAVTGWWRFWPLILIGIGVGMILRRTPAHFVGGLIVAATFGLLFGGLLAGGTHGGFGFGCGSGRSGVALPAESGTFGPDATIDLEMNCGDLLVEPAAGTAWTLIASTPGGRNPIEAVAPDRLEVRSAGHYLVRSVQRRQRGILEAQPSDRSNP